MSGRRTTVIAVCLAGCLVAAGCGPASNDDARVARNCRAAGEGEKLFTTYRPRLAVARDWEQVGWIRQVAITKWLACRHGLANHAPIDDCLDRAAYADRDGKRPFASTLERCVGAAVEKRAE